MPSLVIHHARRQVQASLAPPPPPPPLPPPPPSFSHDQPNASMSSTPIVIFSTLFLLGLMLGCVLYSVLRKSRPTQRSATNTATTTTMATTGCWGWFAGTSRSAALTESANQVVMAQEQVTAEYLRRSMIRASDGAAHVSLNQMGACLDKPDECPPPMYDCDGGRATTSSTARDPAWLLSPPPPAYSSVVASSTLSRM